MKDANLLTSLPEYLQQLCLLSPAFIHYLSQHVGEKKIRKKELLLKSGQLTGHLFFLQKGLVRCFYSQDDKDITNWILPENNILMAHPGLYKQESSPVFIEALEDCTLQYISYEKWIYASLHFPETHMIGRLIAEQYYRLAELHVQAICIGTATERYRFMLKHMPAIAGRVQLKHIASYLNLNIKSLSKARRLYR